MKEYYSVDLDKRKEIIKQIKKLLQGEKEVVFTFVFGSFPDAPAFRDIDIAVYAQDIKKEDIENVEIKLSSKIAETTEMPIDIVEVKVVNFAPISFLNNIFSRGQLLFSKDDKLLTDIIEKSSLSAIANEYIARQSLKELMPA